MIIVRVRRQSIHMLFIHNGNNNMCLNSASGCNCKILQTLKYEKFEQTAACGPGS